MVEFVNVFEASGKWIQRVAGDFSENPARVELLEKYSDALEIIAKVASHVEKEIEAYMRTSNSGLLPWVPKPDGCLLVVIGGVHGGCGAGTLARLLAERLKSLGFRPRHYCVERDFSGYHRSLNDSAGLVPIEPINLERIAQVRELHNTTRVCDVMVVDLGSSALVRQEVRDQLVRSRPDMALMPIDPTRDDCACWVATVADELLEQEFMDFALIPVLDEIARDQLQEHGPAIYTHDGHRKMRLGADWCYRKSDKDVDALLCAMRQPEVDSSLRGIENLDKILKSIFGRMGYPMK